MFLFHHHLLRDFHRQNQRKIVMKPISIFFFFLCVSMFCQLTNCQQAYEENKQLDCYTPDNSTNGYICNGPQKTCYSYLTFRAQPPYDSALSIGYFLNAEPYMIAQHNNITDVDKIPTNTLIIVPITNCSCSGNYYQYNSSYVLKYDYENYYTLANDTYQGLTTCQTLMNQNPDHDSRNLSVGMRLSVPLRCACPSENQTAKGFKFLLSYLVTWADDISSISDAFGADEQSTLEANQLSADSLIYPFTPILVPLKTQPTYTLGVTSQAPSQPPPILITPEEDSDWMNSSSSSTKKWLFVGLGIGLFLLAIPLLGLMFWFLCRRCQGKQFPVSTATPGTKSGSAAVYSKRVQYMIDPFLYVYNFEELQTATAYFNEDNRIKGSVYHGVIKGDNAAIKRMKGDAVKEINILKQIHHSSVVRLSGYCIHEGNAYFVYEFAENGSLSDWLHEEKSFLTPIVRLEWNQRVQIAYDVADGLNYLHNYATPPYIHKDLKSSNILLNGNFRAKIANLGMARAVDEEEEEEEEENVLQLTRHVMGSQGYMAPEYMENGVVTQKMDVFAFGVVILELLSGKEAVTFAKTNGKDGKEVKGVVLLYASINEVLEGDTVREKLKSFIDPSLGGEYPLEMAFAMAQLAKDCVAHDLASRPTIVDVFMSLSKILSSSLDWDPSYELQHSDDGASF